MGTLLAFNFASAGDLEQRIIVLQDQLIQLQQNLARKGSEQTLLIVGNGCLAANAVQDVVTQCSSSKGKIISTIYQPHSTDTCRAQAIAICLVTR